MLDAVQQGSVGVLDIAPPVGVRQKGCFQAVAVLAQPVNNRSEKIGIDQSWLPFSGHEFDSLELKPSADTNETIIPVLLDERATINRMLPILRYHIASNGYDQTLLPVTFFYRPNILNICLFDGHDVDDISQLMSSQFLTTVSTENRAFISLLQNIHDPATYRKLLEITLPVLSDRGIDPTDYGIPVTRSDKEVIQALLMKFPTLVQHIFHALPKLHVLRYKAIICGEEETVEYIRYHPAYFKGIKKKKYVIEDLTHVTV